MKILSPFVAVGEGWHSIGANNQQPTRVQIQATALRRGHTHPFSEVATVLSGRLGYGLGETFDTAKGQLLEAGTFAVVPAKRPHYIWTDSEEAIVQVQFVGPFGIDYVNPADDPRKR